MTAIAPFVLLLLAASPAGETPPDVARCEVADAQTMGELRDRLSLRAIEAVGMAATKPGDVEASLPRLVAPLAVFSLEVGDEHRPLGTGPDAARALARTMDADTFNFLGWDFVPTPVEDPCGRHMVAVDFIDSRRKHIFSMTITFKAGRIVEARGSVRSYVSGPVPRGADAD